MLLLLVTASLKNVFDVNPRILRSELLLKLEVFVTNEKLDKHLVAWMLIMQLIDAFDFFFFKLPWSPLSLNISGTARSEKNENPLK